MAILWLMVMVDGWSVGGACGVWGVMMKIHTLPLPMYLRRLQTCDTCELVL